MFGFEVGHLLLELLHQVFRLVAEHRFILGLCPPVITVCQQLSFLSLILILHLVQFLVKRVPRQLQFGLHLMVITRQRLAEVVTFGFPGVFQFFDLGFEVVNELLENKILTLGCFMDFKDMLQFFFSCF